MKKLNMSVKTVFRLMQLVTYGAIFGLYAVKLMGFGGVELPSLTETAGAGVGAASVLTLKLLHIL